MGVTGILLGDFINPQKPYHVILSYTYKLMSGYLYFPNNLKDIENHIQAYMIIYKIFFQLMGTVVKENLNLQLPPIFYSSILPLYLKQYLFYNKLQITGLKLCQRLVINLSPSVMFFAEWFCSSGLKQFGKFQNHTV